MSLSGLMLTKNDNRERSEPNHLMTPEYSRGTDQLNINLSRDLYYYRPYKNSTI
jgi:hypothetical protein